MEDVKDTKVFISDSTENSSSSSGDHSDTESSDGGFQNITEKNPFFVGEHTISSEIMDDSDDDMWNFISGGLYFNTWNYRKKITLDSDDISGSGSHTNFTILINTIDSDLADYAQDDGDDIAFYQGTTQLDHEIEFYNGTNGELTAWVRIPSLSTSSDTTILMYYGNNTISSQQDLENVWDNEYHAVWHLNEYNFDDSTTNHHNGTNYGALNADGHIAGGKYVDGSDKFIELPDHDDFSFGNGIKDFPFTLSVWYKPSEINREQIIFSKTFSNREYFTTLSSNGRLYLVCYGHDSPSSYIRVYSSDSLEVGNWYLIHWVYNGDSTEEGLSVFLNGQDNSSFRRMSGSYIAMKNTAEELRLAGVTGGPKNDMHGTLDEMRVIGTDRTSDWILTEWNNQNDPSTFMDFGNQEEAGAYTHYTTSDEVRVGDLSAIATNFGQMRFQINLNQGVTILSATLTLWEIVDGTTGNTIVERIDETNVGSLEADTVMPVVTSQNSVDYEWDKTGNEWRVVDITAMMQDQVNLAGWQSEYYFGVRFIMVSEITASNSFEDYSHPDSHHAYVNISYQEELSRNLVVPIAAGMDDDYWQYKSGWTHHTEETIGRLCYDDKRGRAYSNFRWSLAIPQYSTIQYATVTVWEIQEFIEYDATIRRINESNVGPLERDSVIPEVVDTNIAHHTFNKNAGEWITTDITDMLQDQVNLADWSSGNYFGVQFSLDRYLSYSLATDNQLEAYEHVNSHHAFVNVTYIEKVSWLKGWDYRKLLFIPRDVSTGQNYVIPLDVYYGDYFQSSLDHGIRVFTDGKCQVDFDDIRFTDDQGKTLPNYWLERTYEEDSSYRYFTNSSVFHGHYPYNYPAAYYYNNRTYLVFQGDLDQSSNQHYMNIHITYYDHENDTWGDVVYISENVLGYTDGHGSPAVYVTNDGYIHVFAGSHNDYFQHYVSQTPESIQSWTHVNEGNMTGVWGTSDDGSPDQTYAHLFYDSTNDVVHLHYREIYGGVGLVIAYCNSTDGGYTWSNSQTIIDLNLNGGANAERPYQEQGELDPNNPEILHLVWKRYNITRSVQYESIFYAYLNVTSGHLFNASDYDMGTMINNTEQYSCWVYDSETDPCASETVHVDSNSNPYIMWGIIDGRQEKVMFRYWNETSSSWSAVEEVNQGFYRNSPTIDFVVHDSTNITAYIGAPTRDFAQYSWNGKIWTLEETIFDYVSGKGWHYGLIPRGGYDQELIIYNTEWHIAGSDFDFVKLYAWGSKGFLNGTIGKHARFWVELDGDLSTSNQVIYLYYGNSTATSLSSSLDVNNAVEILYGSEENVFLVDDFHLQWEHQAVGIPQDEPVYSITINGVVSAGENVSIELWDGSWLNSNISIDNDSLQGEMIFLMVKHNFQKKKEEM